MSSRTYYDTSYTRIRPSSRSSSSYQVERPTSVTAKYLLTAPSHKSSSIPIRRDGSSTREESPVDIIAGRYKNYSKNTDAKTPKYDKNNYNKLSIPSVVRRSVSPISTSYNRASDVRHLSPSAQKEQQKKAESPDPNSSQSSKSARSKTDQNSSCSNINYKIYPRTSRFIRPVLRSELKPDPIVNRHSFNGPQISNVSKSSTLTQRSVSPEYDKQILKSTEIKNNYENQPTSDNTISNCLESPTNETESGNSESIGNPCNESQLPEKITLVTRHTSPTPPGSSLYVRIRRADLAKTVESTVLRPKKRPDMIDKEIQSDKPEDVIRNSRFNSNLRASVSVGWTGYSPSNHSYTGYAGRFSTQYSGVSSGNTPCNYYYDRSSRSRSKEPTSRDNSINISNNSDREEIRTEANYDAKLDSPPINHENDSETSDIIINVNLKLKQTLNPIILSSENVVSPEIIITNSQKLPPLSKIEGDSKQKKKKIKKPCVDAEVKSEKIKKNKKRSKSISSTDSDQIKIEKRPNKLNNESRSSSYTTSSNRESNSPESSITMSSQSNVSEDDTSPKSGLSNTSSRTTAEDISISTDKSAKQSFEQQLPKSNGPEEAKSFLIRALGPVTSYFKPKTYDSNENNWLESTISESTGKDVSNLTTESDATSKSISDKCENNVVPNEDQFQLINSDRKIKYHIESNDRDSWLVSNSIENQNFDNLKTNQDNNDKSLYKFASDDEKPWWLQSNGNVPEGIEQLSSSHKSSLSNEKKFDFFKVRHVGSGEKKDWWLSSSEKSTSGNNNESSHQQQTLSSSHSKYPVQRIQHVDSGERPWWLTENMNEANALSQNGNLMSLHNEKNNYISSNINQVSLDDNDDEPLGDRRSPDGLEAPREVPLDNRYETNPPHNKNSNVDTRPEKYISRYSDIDDILGTSSQLHSPFMNLILARGVGQISNDEDSLECEEIDSTEVKIHDSTPQHPVIRKYRNRNEFEDYGNTEVDNSRSQIFNDVNGTFWTYEASDTQRNYNNNIATQERNKNSIVLRTPVSVRVQALIERLVKSQGRELRSALFSLKQLLQSDDDLVHGFVANQGLDCLIQLANRTDHNYLDYILRAFGQLLLYVDGMHGVMAHPECIQWLYTLVASKFRHIVKTAFKLLLVFVEYTEENCLLLIDAIRRVDETNGRHPWYKVMKILQDVDASDTELLIYATNLINKCLNYIPDRNIYYDHVDVLLDQGMEDIIQFYMSKQGTDLDLLRQLQIFEATLMLEDGDETGTALKQLDDSTIRLLKRRSVKSNPNNPNRKSKRYQMREKGNHRYTSGLKQRIQNGTLGHSVSTIDTLLVMRNKQAENHNVETKEPITFIKELSIKDIAEKFTSPSSPVTEEKLSLSEMAGIVSKAKEELAKSQSKEKIKSPIKDLVLPKQHEKKISENDLHWEELKKRCMDREFSLCDLDFSDLRHDSDEDIASSSHSNCGAPPPPPPPAMFPISMAPPPPPAPLSSFPRNASYPLPQTSENNNESSSSGKNSVSIKKNKKTVKLFWREIIENPMPPNLKTKIGGFFWDDLPEINIDTKKLEHLFESRSNDLIIKDKIAEPKMNLILDAKRSNAINIAMKKLPTPQTIKVAIMKMDATVIGRDGIEKLLIMLPTEEEKNKIQEAQYANPDLPLGSAEQFLLTLASITELSSRLKLWVFKLDFDNIEKEIAEPLMDLKHGIELLKDNKTFKLILATLRSVGSFLNGSEVKGFRLDYLSKVMEVKDTVHKHPLLYHLCEMIIEKFPDTSDLFSEVGPVIRASKVDYDMLNANLAKLEYDCKASWDHLKRVTKHDGSHIFKTKMNEFLTDAAERIILLSVIKKRVMNRFTKFLLYLGIPLSDVDKMKISEFLKVIAEFSLEYRTSRERVLQQSEKKSNLSDRSKPKPKEKEVTVTLIKTSDNSAESALKELLKSDPYTDSISDRRRKISQPIDYKHINGDAGEDEIIKSLVQSTTSKRHTNSRDRKKSNRINNRTEIISK